MQIFDLTSIPNCPTDTYLGYSTIEAELSPDNLSEEERKEWEGFTNQTRKDEFLTARTLFRSMLEQKGLSQDFVLKKEATGKPYAKQNSIRLNVSFSHSKEYVMCAISLKKDIGLDIESSRRIVDKRLIKRILNEQEWKVLGEEDPIVLWTMKEAAVKCLGTGLRTNLRDLELKKIDKNHFSIRINDDKSFQICSFTALDHQISIAY